LSGDYLEKASAKQQKAHTKPMAPMTYDTKAFMMFTSVESACVLFMPSSKQAGCQLDNYMKCKDEISIEGARDWYRWPLYGEYMDFFHK
jgi:hypothetical protein